MCGIIGYIGNDEKKSILLSGLRELEYRGYDSAGICVLEQGELRNFKAVGKLINLERKCESFALKVLDWALDIRVGQRTVSQQK